MIEICQNSIIVLSSFGDFEILSEKIMPNGLGKPIYIYVYIMQEFSMYWCKWEPKETVVQQLYIPEKIISVYYTLKHHFSVESFFCFQIFSCIMSLLIQHYLKQVCNHSFFLLFFFWSLLEETLTMTEKQIEKV